MGLLDRFICAFERRNLRAERDAIYRHELDLVAVSRLVRIHVRLIELGDKPRATPPHLGEESGRMVQMVEDNATPAHHWHGYGNARPVMYHDSGKGRGKR